MAVESRRDLASCHGSIVRIAAAHSWSYRSDNPICTRTLYIEEMFTGTDISDFVGSVRCTTPAGGGEGMFTGVAVELNEGNRILTTLPVVSVQERMSQE